MRHADSPPPPPTAPLPPPPRRRKRDAIEPLHALGLLPGEAPLPTALPFLEGGLLGAGERRRAASLGRSLRRAEHVGVLAQLAQEKQRWGWGRG